MARSMSLLRLNVASIATCGLLITGATTAQAAPAAFDTPAARPAIVAGAPAVHTVHGRIIAVGAPAGDVSPTITVDVRRRPASGAAEIKRTTFPVAAGAPIKLIGNGTTRLLTPAGLRPGRPATLLVSNGVVNEIDLFARRSPTAGYVSNLYYSPYWFSSSNWYAGPYRHGVRWNHFGPWYGNGWAHASVRTSHHGVAGHRAHVSHLKRGKKSGRHKAHRVHHAHPGHHARVKHRAHAAKHAHPRSHHGGGHHKK